MTAADSPATAPTDAALRHCVHLRSFDPGVMRVAVQQSDIEHVQVSPGVFDGIVTHAASPGLRTDWGNYNLPVQARGVFSRDMLTVGLVIGGDGDWRVQGAAASLGDMLLFAEGSEMLMNLPPNAQWLAVQVSRERVEALGVPLGGLRGVSAWRMRAVQGDPSHEHLADVAPALAPQADGFSAGAGFDVQAAQEQLFAAMVCDWERRRACSSSAADRLQPGERWRVLRRAEAYLEANADATLRIDNLCAAACTSVATLERSFREVLGLTPRRYLTLRRLARVRSELLNGDPGESITDVAMRWGFFHLGRFAQEYGQLYHERPSQTRSRRVTIPRQSRGHSGCEPLEAAGRGR
jgi:AraC family ethanolamine operon transcriptional activator